jgi:Tfp pilus assembly protein FimT
VTSVTQFGAVQPSYNCMKKEELSSARLPIAGFTMVEICIILMLLCILGSFAILSINSILPGITANEAMYQTVDQLRNAREAAIGQRRTVEIQFLNNNQIQLIRYDLPDGTTTIRDTTLSNGCRFTLFGDIPDTPDMFGNAAPVNFPGANTLRFLSDGTLVNDQNNPVSGSIFIGSPNHPETARAVTILGATGRVRSYRWTGTDWIQ